MNEDSAHGKENDLSGKMVGKNIDNYCVDENDLHENSSQSEHRNQHQKARCSAWFALHTITARNKPRSLYIKKSIFYAISRVADNRQPIMVWTFYKDRYHLIFQLW